MNRDIRNITLNVETIGDGPPVVFLHGLVGSHSYWNRVAGELSGRTLYLIDLLGFGDSPKPTDSSYNIDQHANALHHTLAKGKIKHPFMLVGHSMGALIAIRYAAKYPDSVSKVILCNTPLFMRDTGLSIIAGSDIAPKFIVQGRIAKIICISSRHMPFVEKLLRYFPHRLPADIKADMLKHTWNSYSKSLENLIVNYTPAEDLETLSMPVVALLGERDSVTSPMIAKVMLPENVKTHIVKNADHHIPIFHTDELASFIK